MTERILVAGATGALGLEVVKLLKAHGHCVAALGRPGPRLDRLRGQADRLLPADALRQEQLRGACNGVDRVFSCLGASVIPSPRCGRQPFTAVDLPANLNLIREAERSGEVRKIVYVSVFGHDRLPWSNFVRGHEGVVEALKQGQVPYAVLRPTGFFSAMREIMGIASRGLLPEFAGGTPRTNPIHEADLAEVAVDALFGSYAEREVGGPEPLTRRQIAEQAFAALGKQVRTVRVPVQILRAGGYAQLPLFPRVGHLMIFISHILTADFVAPCYGTRTIGQFFREMAARR